ncbi:glycoside hydrolase family 28 protein [Auriscalpium vulgare]|uniref:Glycoside hydrolase family 28 protein n=1 Tax=Auriscalpium vulgare TaxID=40419 RepID=A0ACB8RJR5_9AGAM|nr:glycoside hydrolase family 28 protein [Auriscalpium vulgare]
MGNFQFFLASILAFFGVCLDGIYAVSCTLRASGGDDGPALKAAAQRCSTVLIPNGVILSIGTALDMTGLRNTHINVQGTVKFTDDVPYWTGNAFFFDFQNQSTFWLLGGKNILLDGGGTIDGSGQIWYDEFATNASLIRPIILTVFNGEDVVIRNIKQINSPEWFNLVHSSERVLYDQVHINAISTSSNTIKNTDGWDIYRSNSVAITNSVINNGDDCVSFKPNATNILVANLRCNGSHGISVGSLGQYPGVYDIVENVLATNITMSNAQNGARIKAWAGPNVGSGIVKNITFSKFFETNVDNPVVIDQCYETSAALCTEFPSNTYIQDVWFDDISGTSSGAEKGVVASLACSPDGRCSDINVNNLSLSPPPGDGNATFSCQNVNVTGNAASMFGTCPSTA